MAERPQMRGRLLATARLLMGALIVAAILATFAETASRGPINPFNFFGYFTIQSNSILAATAVLAGAVGLARPGIQPRWLVLLRSLATVCMIVVGLVYAVLLAPLGLEGGVPAPWANWVMHVIGPTLAVADWLFSGDKVALPWRAAYLQLGYPIA